MQPTLVLLHGAGRNARFWELLRAALPAQLPVLAPDLPGRDGKNTPSRVSEIAEYLEHDLEGCGPIVLLGHSLGGAVAVECALRGAMPVAGLVLACTGAKLKVAPAVLSAVSAAVERGQPFDLSDVLYLRSTPAEIRARFESLPYRSAPAAEAADWGACDGFDRLATFKQIALPTLVVGGTEDPLTPPRYASALASGISGARLEMIPGASHMLPIESPEVLAALVVDFVRSLG